MESIKIYSMVILAVTSLSYGVKVNMRGSLSFGKDVIETLTDYVNSHHKPSRRSMTYSKQSDVLYLTIQSAHLCRELIFCEGKLQMFVNEYITAITTSIKDVFESVLSQEQNRIEINSVNTHVFEDQLRVLLSEVRKLLKTANMKVTEKTEAYHWMDIIKKVSAEFQEAAIATALYLLETNNKEYNIELKKKLTQKFVIATVIVESQYEKKLCANYNICSKSYECTIAFNDLLGAFPNLDEEKVKTFMRYIYIELQDSTFYSHLAETTAIELQTILNDMSFSDSVPTKTVLSSIQKTVEGKLMSVRENTYFVGSKDVELVHIILSDMDHLFANEMPEPFHKFLKSFYHWTRSDTKLRTHIHKLILDIVNTVLKAPKQLQVKLIKEVKVFLELTVDPEN